MRPVGAGLMAGATLSLVVDEGLTAALGLSAPNRTYPAATHVRGFLAHLVWGTAAALAAEALYRLTGTAPVRAGPLARPWWLAWRNLVQPTPRSRAGSGGRQAAPVGSGRNKA